MTTVNLADPTLDMAAAVVDNLEGVRIANLNRIRIMVSTEPDEDGITRGWGLPIDHPNVVMLRNMVGAIKEIEDKAVKHLERQMKSHPMGQWVNSQVGIGFKQAARLLSALGDPYINANTEKPRTVAQLWAYCGFHVVDGSAARRQKGVKLNWNTKAKMRVFLVANSCLKHRHSPFRKIYDERRLHTSMTHPDWTLGHSHNDAIRVMGKEILKAIWIEARRLHGGPDGTGGNTVGVAGSGSSVGVGVAVSS